MFKKILIGIGIALFVLLGIWGYFLYAGDQSLVRNRIANNPIYTIIFFLSIVSIYFLQGGNKIFRFLILIIVLINLFILGNIFFINNIGLNNQQFMILFGLVLLALAVSYIGHRIRILLISILGLGIVFVVVSSVLPMYEYLPNIDKFLQSTKTQIINQGANEGTITLKNTLGDKEIQVKNINIEDIDLSQKTQILFKSKITEEEVFIYIQNGGYITLPAQSAITLEQKENTTSMQILQGDIHYYIPEEYSGTLEIMGNKKGTRIENIETSDQSDIIKYIEEQKEKFFVKALGGEWVLNPTINKIIKFFITNLHRISPKKYQNNFDNYNTIQNYLGNTNEENTENLTGENLKSMINDIRSQAKKGTENTKFFNTLFE